jgi:hypothetical protein
VTFAASLVSASVFFVMPALVAHLMSHMAVLGAAIMTAMISAMLSTTMVATRSILVLISVPVNCDLVRVKSENEQVTHGRDVMRGDAPQFIFEPRPELVTRPGGPRPAQEHESHAGGDKTLNGVCHYPKTVNRLKLELLAH